MTSQSQGIEVSYDIKCSSSPLYVTALQSLVAIDISVVERQ